MDGTIQRRDQTSWNIAQKHADFVATMMIGAMRNFRQGKLDEWFWDLKVVREITYHDMKTIEIDELDTMEEDILKINLRVRGNLNNFKIAVLPYQRKIMKILKAQGYFPNKEDRTKLNF